jgi:hypothetical protein
MRFLKLWCMMAKLFQMCFKLQLADLSADKYTGLAIKSSIELAGHNLVLLFK